MKTRIRFLINTLAGGGAEKVLVDLLKHMDPARYDITLVTIWGGVWEKQIPGHVTLRRLVRPSRLERFWGNVVSKLPPKLFAALFLRGRFDFEVAYLEGRPTRFVAAKPGRKYAFVHCDLSVGNIISPLYKDRQACLAEYRRFSKVCFVSEKCREGFAQVIGQLENGCVVHNVVDMAAIRQKAQESVSVAYRTAGWKLVTVGRLVKAKAYDRLLRVVSELEKSYALELWILGEGEEHQALEQMIGEMGIRSVRLLGYRENPYPFIRQADLFVCSSLFEGYSTAVTEAVALSVPVVTTDCAGMNEILENGTCGLIVENSEEGLRNGLRHVFEDRECYEALKQAVREKSVKVSSGQAIGEYTALFSLGDRVGNEREGQ